MIAALDKERERVEREIRLAEEGDDWSSGGHPDMVGRRRRTGLRFLVGSDVDNTSGALIGVGLYRWHRLASATAIAWRFDWTKRDDDMVEHKTIALGTNLTRRLLDLRRFELAAIAGVRAELRYGAGIPSPDWNRGGLGGDIGLELLPRALPATLGVRFHHSLTDPARSSSLFVELGFEVR